LSTANAGGNLSRPGIRGRGEVSRSAEPVLATIGYENSTVESFLQALEEARIDLLVDVRAAARSRRIGFAKTRLRANVEERGVGYIHLPGLGTPADGRAAARAGDHDTMRSVFAEHLRSATAQSELETLIGLIRSGRRVCILCLEENPAHCHRSMVADAVAERLPVQVEHLHPEPRE
jgi:uncharacterized protein (DUF488 family)